MDLYTRVSYDISQLLTRRYSSSFGTSSRLFSRTIRADIYAVYGLVRIADEIVDTYAGDDARRLLDSLERETYDAIKAGYSTNPIVHSFALTAVKYGITKQLIEPFFASMRMDLAPVEYGQAEYERYIYGSAEVVGLMCLRVFCKGDDTQYASLAESARALGSAYQKVNFLRDITSDYIERGRVYFPGIQYDQFSDSEKNHIVSTIAEEFAIARRGISRLPANSKAAVMLSIGYYGAVLSKLQKASVKTIKTRRLRVNGVYKMWLLIVTVLRYKVLS